MKTEDDYDLIILVSNNLNHDRRLHRTCAALASKGLKILTIGRSYGHGDHISFPDWETRRVVCRNKKGPLFYFELLRQFKKELSALRFSRLLCMDEDTIGILNQIDTSGIQVYFDAHELFSEVPELQGRPIKKWVWNQWARPAIRKVDCCYTVNQSIAKILTEKYEKEFQVVLNVPSLNPDQLTSSSYNESPAGPIQLVYLGALNPGRGLELLIPAIRDMPKFELVVIGDGPQRQRLESISHDRVQFIGMKHPSEIPQYLAQAAIGVNLLSRSSPSYYYSLANKFFDYLHAGLPILCMDYPEYSNINKQYDCCYMVDDYTSEGTLKALELIITEKSLVAKSSQSLRAAHQYNWNLEQMKLLQLFSLA